MMDLAAFRTKVRDYRRLAGHTQKELAAALGLHADVLSHKLNGIGGALLTHADIKRIILTLAEWLALASQAEALELLALVDLRPDVFSETEWNAPPLGDLHPAPRTPSAPPAQRLPIPLTPLLGRTAEVAAITDSLCQAKVRLLTLTGPGGVGKTRLALHVASLARPAFAGEVAFVQLASVADPAHVLPAIAQALQIDTRAATALPDVLSAALADRHVLLILDNCEHVLSASNAIGELLAAAPSLTVLATSRSPLHLYGEQEYPVPPLAWPEEPDAHALAELDRYPALQLFAARARAVRPDFALTPTNVGTVTHICEQLDGLPLAIELAAARLTYLSLETLQQRLTDRLNLLAGGAHNVPARQQTLRNTLAWSYDLLTPDERQCCTRLGVFVGTFTVPEAAEICQSADEMQPMLERLMDKSLVQLDRSYTGNEPRYGLLATIRTYALERLAANGESDAMHARHAAFYVNLAETWEPTLTGARQQEGMQVLEDAYSNIRAALQLPAPILRNPCRFGKH